MNRQEDNQASASSAKKIVSIQEPFQTLVWFHSHKLPRRSAVNDDEMNSQFLSQTPKMQNIDRRRAGMTVEATHIACNGF